MPIFFQKDIDQDTKLGIWKIEEEELFFLQKVLPQRNVSHPHKKLQHLAGRYLLNYLFPHFPVQLILIADTRKPYLKDEAYHFSISHCGNYAAAIVSKSKRVGVDIELPSVKVEKIKHKFLSKEEMELVDRQWAMSNRRNVIDNRQEPVGNNITLQPSVKSYEQPLSDIKKLTLFWSCKEAVFKWYGLGEVDFKEHMVIEKIKQISEDGFQTEICFKKEASKALILDCCFFKEIVLSYVVSKS
jgi:phosphopantetheinyl transferase